MFQSLLGAGGADELGGGGRVDADVGDVGESAHTAAQIVDGLLGGLDVGEKVGELLLGRLVLLLGLVVGRVESDELLFEAFDLLTDLVAGRLRPRHRGGGEEDDDADRGDGRRTAAGGTREHGHEVSTFLPPLR